MKKTIVIVILTALLWASCSKIAEEKPKSIWGKSKRVVDTLVCKVKPSSCSKK